MTRPCNCFVAVFTSLLALVRADRPSCSSWDLSCLIEEDSRSPHRAVCAKRVEVALIGAGQFARKAHLPSLLQDAPDCFDLRFIWSRSRSAAEAAATSVVDQVRGVAALWGDSGWKELLAMDVELFDIVLPIREQVTYVEEALSCGFNVISEKPIADKVSRGLRILQPEGRSTPCAIPGKPHKRGQWFVAENWRFETPFRVAARARESGAIGDIVMFDASSLSYIPEEHPLMQPGSWRRRADGNWITDVAVHMAAALRLVLGLGADDAPRGWLAVHGVAASHTRPELLPFDSFAAALVATLPGHAERVIGTWLFSLSAPRQEHPPEVPGLSNMNLRISGSNGTIFVTRARIELRDRDGKLVDSASGLAGHSVADALRAAALAVIAHRATDGLDIGDVAASLSPSQALSDLRLVESIVEAGKTSLDGAPLEGPAFPVNAKAEL